MRFALALVAILLAVWLETTGAATTYELEAKKFIQDASSRFYKLYDQIAAETYSSIDDDDFDTIFSKLETVKTIANELVEISKEASEFDIDKVHDSEIKAALRNLRMAGDLFVLGEDYFSTVLINLSALRELATDKDIEPYLGGANMPDQDDSPLAYFPDIQKIFQNSRDPDELKYYWETWREKNLVWSSINFYTIIDAIKTATNQLDVPVLDYWYRYYNNKDFLAEMEKVMQELKPFYQQLHAYVRHELHKKYGDDVINPKGPIPDHMFQQVIDQAWQDGSVLENYFPHRDLPPYDAFVEDFDAKKLIDEAERFYTSLGFDPLDEAFYSEHLKAHEESENTGDCKADIFDITPQVYMRYCQKVSFRKFMQNHGYMARVHYAKEKRQLPAYFFNSYDLEYPVGEAVILSASTPKHLGAIGLTKDFKFNDDVLMNRLFRMCIHTMLNIPQFFVHNKVMNELLEGTIDMEGVNSRYWKLMETYAGVEPPVDRSEGAIDFPYKFYTDLEENHQTKKFVSEILGYQFYRAFCKKSGHTGDQLHNCDFFGNLSIGNGLKSMMALGSSKPWREVIAKILPENPTLSGDALLDYYSPVHDWLKNKNKESSSKIGWDASTKKVL